MSKVNFEFDVRDIEKLVAKLSLEDRIRIARRLYKETIRNRWDKILKSIDTRRKKYPITEPEIAKEVEAVRLQIYNNDKSRR